MSGKSKKIKIDKDSPLQKLEKIVAANYFVVLKNCVREKDSEILQILRPSVKIATEYRTKKNIDEVLLAFNVHQNEEDNKSEKLGVIIGPNTEIGNDKIAEFYQIWGKDKCKLRRFQDGSTHESVSLNNPSGLIYMPLAKVTHIMQTHYPKIQVKFLHFNEDYRISCRKSYENLLERRKFIEEFCSKIRQVLGHGTEMPLRKIEPICACLYKGDTTHHFHKLNKTHR